MTMTRPNGSHAHPNTVARGTIGAKIGTKNWCIAKIARIFSPIFAPIAPGEPSKKVLALK
jgi:hypothetical protein